MGEATIEEQVKEIPDNAAGEWRTVQDVVDTVTGMVAKQKRGGKR